MEWQLPIQKMEISNIHIGNPWGREIKSHFSHKPMAPLSYFGPQFRLPFVSLLFPPLLVKEFNPSSGKLVLDISESHLACIKLNTLQETLINAIYYHQYSWFKTDYSKEEIISGFQQIYQDSNIILHYPNQGVSRNIPIYQNNNWDNSTQIQVGMRIRVAVKIHGISFLNRNDNDSWSGKCRVQHKILGIIIQE